MVNNGLSLANFFCFVIISQTLLLCSNFANSVFFKYSWRLVKPTQVKANVSWHSFSKFLSFCFFHIDLIFNKLLFKLHGCSSIWHNCSCYRFLKIFCHFKLVYLFSTIILVIVNTYDILCDNLNIRVNYNRFMIL